MRRIATLILLLGVALLPAPTGAQAPAPDLDELLRRVGDYVQGFIDDFTNVVAEENYEQHFRQSAPRRRLKSDFLLVGYPGQDKVMLTFRDVLEVNGRPIGGKDERVTRLFLQPFGDAVRRATEIQSEGSRQSLDRGRLADPLAVLAYLQPAYQTDFQFSLGGLDRDLGPGVREVNARQRLRPTQPSQPVFRMKAWVSESTGELMKTEMIVDTGRRAAITMTRFAYNAALGIHVPVEMEDAVPIGSDEFVATAKYTNFKRFKVQVDQEIDVPPATR